MRKNLTFPRKFYGNFNSNFFLRIIHCKYQNKKILIVTHGGTSVIIKCYFMNYSLENLVGRYDIKGLKNCEVARFEM